MSDFDAYIFCPTCKSKLNVKRVGKEESKVCPQCGFTFWNNPKPSISALISQNGKVLMLQRPEKPFKDFWVLPGGYMTSKETPEKAVIRETKEETMLTVKPKKLIGVYRSYDPRGIDIDIIFSVDYSGEITLSTEHKKWKFFDPHDLPKHIAYKHREAILDWVKIQ